MFGLKDLNLLQNRHRRLLLWEQLFIPNRAVLENATIVFNQGKITQIGGIAPANNAKIINAHGKHVYPGFILVNNSLGLVEIEATKATVDYQEANDITPEMRTLIAFNTDSQCYSYGKNQWDFAHATCDEKWLGQWHLIGYES